MPEGGPSAPDEPLRRALVATGAIGSTTRQLSSRLDWSEEELGPVLDRLERRGKVLRLGRGLWVLSDFADLTSRAGFIEPAEYAERLADENGVRLGEYRGPITFSDNTELPVHRWWPYVQGFSANFVGSVLAGAALPAGSTVVDPFAGSGTTLVEARRAGLRGVGRELLPPAALAARVKTRFELAPFDLAAGARRLMRSARRAAPGPVPFLRETARHFRAAVLRDLLRIRDRLPPEGTRVADALRIAFARTLIPVSRLRRSPCLGYGRPDAEASHDVFAELNRAVQVMQADLASLRTEAHRWGPPASVVCGDARQLRLPAGKVALAITSPPYVSGMDYVNNYKIDLAWLGYARSYADLRALRTRLVACDNLGRGDVAGHLQTEDAPDPWLREILRAIRANVARKGTYRRNDVHGVVKRYFLDLLPVLRAVHRGLRPQGRLVLVVGDSLLAGTYVPADLLLARLGAAIGFRIASVDVARIRRSGQRRSFQLRETVVTLEKPSRT